MIIVLKKVLSSTSPAKIWGEMSDVLFLFSLSLNGYDEDILLQKNNQNIWK